MRERIPARFGLDPFRDVQVLTPMNRSELGAQALNLRLQEVLNPPRGGRKCSASAGRSASATRCMQTRQQLQKEVFNGDIGRITAIDETEREMTVEFDGKPVVYDFGELDELTLAYRHDDS